MTAFPITPMEPDMTPRIVGLSENARGPLTRTVPRATQPVAQMMRITPTLAESWLTSNLANRPVTENKVRQYAADMIAGKWRVNGESIIIGKDGTLLNGQHRLAAVVRSGVAIESMVTWDVDPDTFTTMDTGRPRGATDVLAIKGYQNTARLAGSANAVNAYYKLGVIGRTSARIRFTNDEMLTFVLENPTIVDSVTRVERTGLRIKGTSPSNLAAIHFLIGPGNEPKRDAFFDALDHGANLGSGHPVLALRNRLHANAATRTMDDMYVAAIIVKSWTAFKAGRTISLLRWSNRSDNPEPFPVIL